MYMIYLRHIYRHSDIDMTNWNYIIKQAYYCNFKIYISTIVYSTDKFKNPDMKFKPILPISTAVSYPWYISWILKKAQDCFAQSYTFNVREKCLHLFSWAITFMLIMSKYLISADIKLQCMLIHKLKIYFLYNARTVINVISNTNTVLISSTKFVL